MHTQYAHAGSSPWHTFSKSGGLKWLGSSISASLLEPTVYTLGFILGSSASGLDVVFCSTEHVHGWNKKPVRFQLSTSDGQNALSQCYLDEPGSWVLYHAGDFVSTNPRQALKLKFSMAQIDCTHTKGGLCVDSVLVYPKGFQQEKVVTGKISEMRSS